MNIVALLGGLALIASGAADIILSSLGPPTQALLSGYSGMFFGVVVLIYGVFNTPEYSRLDRPLGMAISAVALIVSGVVIAGVGVVLLFVPIFGILALLILGIGAGTVYLGKIVWEGDKGGLQVFFVLTLIPAVIGVIQSIFRLGTPIMAVYELWYLRRPHVLDYYYGRAPVKLGPPPLVPPSKPALRFSGEYYGNVCQVCGSRNPPRAMYCFNCSMLIEAESPSSTTPVERELLEAKLERAEEDLQKMDQLKAKERIVDRQIFEKAREAKTTQAYSLREALRRLESG